MNYEQLFLTALKVEDPLYIKEFTFSVEDRELHFHLDFRRGGKFTCSECFLEDLPVKSSSMRTWRHLNFYEYRCFIHMRTPRTMCPDCGAKTWVPPWARKQSGFTLLFEEYLLSLVREMPVKQVAKRVDEHDTRIWRVVKRYVFAAYARKCFKGVVSVGIDETSARKGHRYISVFADMKTGDVLFATPGRSSEAVDLFAKELPLHGSSADEIKETVSDMSVPFIAGIKKFLPNASMTFNKFHIVKAFNSALDQVRRSEQAGNKQLKNSRYVWLKNPSNLTASQRKKLESFSGQNLKTGRVYRKKLVLQEIYSTAANSTEALAELKKWLSWAVRSRLEPVKKFAQMIKNHLPGVLRYFDTRLTTGLVEGINSRIQEVKRRAKGFRNINNFIAMVYLEAANLDLEILVKHAK